VPASQIFNSIGDPAMTQTASALSTDAKTAIAEALNQSVAETAVTTMLAQNFHWNVKGMAFGPLHALFQEIYEDHFTAQDDLAERIRAIDMHAEGMLAGMLKRSKIDEHDGHATDKEMIKSMQEAQETLAATLAGCGELAAKHGDTLTEDLCIARGQTHEKFAWFLRSHLG
jgi:starvation-inducible DNA-binding protein